MEDNSSEPGRVVELVESESHEAARPALERLEDAPAADRSEAIRSLRTLAEDRAGPMGQLLPAVASFSPSKRSPTASPTADDAPVGSLDAVRETTTAAIDELTTPDAGGECPHCGLELPESGPPMYPRCGAPR